MEFEFIENNPDHKIKIRFNDEEAEVIRAVYLEGINRDAKLGNTTVSDFDWSMAGYGMDENPPWKLFISSERLIEKLNDFHERTDEVITEIALDCALPDYDNWQTLYRNSLGGKALDLANELEASTMPKDINEVDIPDCLPEDWTSSDS